jgi:hypothetical protein
MRYYSKPLPDGRWGIYTKQELLATIGSQEECQAMIDALNQRQPRKQRLKKRHLQPDDQKTTPYRVRRLSLPDDPKAQDTQQPET